MGRKPLPGLHYALHRSPSCRGLVMSRLVAVLAAIFCLVAVSGPPTIPLQWGGGPSLPGSPSVAQVPQSIVDQSVRITQSLGNKGVGGSGTVVYTDAEWALIVTCRHVLPSAGP